jgi:hypothetical protein
MMSVIIVSVILHNDECHNGECHIAECSCTKSHYAKCHYAECRGADDVAIIHFVSSQECRMSFRFIFICFFIFSTRFLIYSKLNVNKNVKSLKNFFWC